MITITIHCETCGETVDFKEGFFCGQAIFTHRGKNPIHVKNISRNLDLLDLPFTISSFNDTLKIEESFQVV